MAPDLIRGFFVWRTSETKSAIAEVMLDRRIYASLGAAFRLQDPQN
jgi:hypothetical protein